MRKLTSILLILALALSLALPAFAAGEDYTDLSFTYTAPEPKYTVSIPSSLSLEVDTDNYLTLEVVEMAEVAAEGKSVVFTLASTSQSLTAFDPESGLPETYYWTRLWAQVSDPEALGFGKSFWYVLYDADGNQLSENPVVFPLETALSEMPFVAPDKALAAFDEAGQKDITIFTPYYYNAWNADPNVEFKDVLTFGIKLV